VTSGIVADGKASVSYILPGNTPRGKYHIHAVYVPKASNPDFTISTDTTDGTLKVL